MRIRVVYDQTRVGPAETYASIESAIEDMPGKGWIKVGRAKRHRPEASTITLRSIDEKGERIALMFIGDEDPMACRFCDTLIGEGDLDARWNAAHVACVTKAMRLIAARRPSGGMGRKGAWGLQAIQVVEPGSDEATKIEQRRQAKKPEMTKEQREEAAFLRAMADGGSP